jgi:hypothetical protein
MRTSSHARNQIRVKVPHNLSLATWIKIRYKARVELQDRVQSLRDRIKLQLMDEHYEID